MRLRRRHRVDADGSEELPVVTTVVTDGHVTDGHVTDGPVSMPANPLDDPGFVAGLRPVPSGIGDAPTAWPAADVAGVAPDGTPVALDLDARHRPVLLVFLSTNCDGCDLFWRGLAVQAPRGVDAVVVTKRPAAVPDYELSVLADAMAAPVVLSDRAWADYRVTGYPFLVLVDPATRRILGESVGFGWSDVATLLGDPGVR